MRGHYETRSGDRTTLMELDGQWTVAFSYAHPSKGLQLLTYGTDEREAVRVFTLARSNASDLLFDSRERWVHQESV